MSHASRASACAGLGSSAAVGGAVGWFIELSGVNEQVQVGGDSMAGYSLRMISALMMRKLGAVVEPPIWVS